MTLRRRIAAGEVLVGALVNLGSAVTAEIMAHSGFDWLVLDLEHGAGGETDALAQLQAMSGSGVPVLVRVEALDRPRFGRVLDLGAAGILVPRLDCGDEARRAVDYCKYAGSRGVARYNRAWSWGLSEARLEDVDADVVCAVLIETAAALEAVEEIASIDGVDVLVVGPVDLAHSLAITGRRGGVSLDERIAAVADAAATHGKAVGIIAPSLSDVTRYRDIGFTFLGYGSDSSLLAAEASRVAAVMQRAKEPAAVQLIGTGE